MEIIQETKLHNKFEFYRELPDGREELLGVAHNIVLDSYYTRVIGAGSTITHIHLGNGTTDPLPSNVSLGGFLIATNTSREVEEYSYTTSRTTFKASLGVGVGAGATYTEIGLAVGSTNNLLVTHALIKDSEGNPIAITKQDLEVLNVYATVYLTVPDLAAETNGALQYLGPPANNALLTRCLGKGSSLNWPITNGLAVEPISRPDGGREYDYVPAGMLGPYISYATSPAVTWNEALRELRIARTMGTSVGNNTVIRSTSSGGISMKLPAPETIPAVPVKYTLPGVDGSKTGWQLPATPAEQPVVRINGVTVPETDYTWSSEEEGPFEIKWVKKLNTHVTDPSVPKEFSYGYVGRLSVSGNAVTRANVVYHYGKLILTYRETTASHVVINSDKAYVDVYDISGESPVRLDRKVVTMPSVSSIHPRIESWDEDVIVLDRVRLVKISPEGIVTPYTLGTEISQRSNAQGYTRISYVSPDWAALWYNDRDTSKPGTTRVALAKLDKVTGKIGEIAATSIPDIQHTTSSAVEVYPLAEGDILGVRVYDTNRLWIGRMDTETGSTSFLSANTFPTSNSAASIVISHQTRKTLWFPYANPNSPDRSFLTAVPDGPSGVAIDTFSIDAGTSISRRNPYSGDSILGDNASVAWEASDSVVYVPHRYAEGLYSGVIIDKATRKAEQPNLRIATSGSTIRNGGVLLRGENPYAGSPGTRPTRVAMWGKDIIVDNVEGLIDADPFKLVALHESTVELGINFNTPPPAGADITVEYMPASLYKTDRYQIRLDVVHKF